MASTYVGCYLGVGARVPSIQHGNEIRFALRTTAMAVEVSTLLDRERQVMDVGFDVTGGLQGNRLSADDTQDCAAHDHLLARDHPRNLPLLTDDDLGRLNVTLDIAIDLQHAPANDLEPLANNHEIVTDD